MDSIARLALLCIVVAVPGCCKCGQMTWPDLSNLQKLDLAGASASPGKEYLYYDAKALGVEGRGWPRQRCENYYDRLPADANGVVSKANWDLSKNSAGMCVTFVTDSNVIAMRYKLKSSQTALNHMPATGVSGIDIYINDNGKWHLIGMNRNIKYPITDDVSVKNITPGTYEYRAYLPLYNGLEFLEIGIRKNAFVAKAPPRPADRSRPIVFYGTSILQGACASRPGMAHTNILGRRLDYPTINLGFSGSAHMEPQVADLMAQIDAAAYVLDALPNMEPPEVKKNYEQFVLKLRKAHPKTPIILCESADYQAMEYIPFQKAIVTGDNEYMKVAYKNMLAKGITGLFYVTRKEYMGTDGEGVVEGWHASDLGFVRMADALEPVLRKALKQ
jgi:hypothetical protein